MQLTLCAPCLFGLEGLLAKELKKLGMRDVRAEDGRVFFAGSERDIVRANLWLRTAERVYIVLADGEAMTFDALFELAKAAPWEIMISHGGKFPVGGHCLDSALMSVPDCQKILKKAMAVRLGAHYGCERMPETGETYPVQFLIRNNRALLMIDSSGTGLHKRGYRALSGEAPLRETLAAGLVMLSGYRGRGAFMDPFCGSGTIPIEAALIALNRAPGLGRSFAFEAWPRVPVALAEEERRAAGEREFAGPYTILGSDISPEAVALAVENAEKAGVSAHIAFSVMDARDIAPLPGVIVANPPYGVRLMDNREAASLMRTFGKKLDGAGETGCYVLTADPEFERFFGRKAPKRRKLYNGMLRCTLFQYPAEKMAGGTAPRGPAHR
ncbi:class I SAM-dependent RNA methyltransferase [Oscillospiraceae bacterium OttesenSCG-928-F05]|nr:class I SAM-dependent RNA methyltransferase [Oscillospiraceae bacterium OttesenSCG-928-F05]